MIAHAPWRLGSMPLTVAAVLLMGAAAMPRAALAWGSAEHQEIGAESYRRACAEIAPLAMEPASDAGLSERFQIACGRNVDAFAKIYGDATAIAGDYVGDPSELTSSTGAWRFSSKKHYWRLALENSAHFYPMAI